MLINQMVNRRYKNIFSANQKKKKKIHELYRKNFATLNVSHGETFNYLFSSLFVFVKQPLVTTIQASVELSLFNFKKIILLFDLQTVKHGYK